eukprot:SAG31_NODE_762_length_12275_cov_14.077119_8_plen_117_part_00
MHQCSYYDDNAGDAHDAEDGRHHASAAEAPVQSVETGRLLQVRIALLRATSEKLATWLQERSSSRSLTVSAASSTLVVVGPMDLQTMARDFHSRHVGHERLRLSRGASASQVTWAR